MTDAVYSRFGDRGTFAIEARLCPDPNPESAPAEDVWSFGDLRIFVRNRCMTRHTAPGGPRDQVRWYLAPLLRWLHRAWLPLLHEQRPLASLGPHENFILRFEQAERLAIDDESDEGSHRRSAMQAWRKRHALWTSAAGGVLPNLWFRRQSDLCEISYDPGTTVGAPRDFEFQFSRGAVLVDIGDVAETFLEFLRWGADAGVAAGMDIQLPSDSDASGAEAEQWLIGNRLARFLADARIAQPRLAGGLIYPSPPEVAMFGTVTPELSAGDARVLLDALCDARSGERESVEMISLTEPLPPPTRETSWEQGYGFAVETLSSLGLGSARRFVDVERIVARLGISVRSIVLDDPSLRGVAIAGQGFHPTILINGGAKWNRNGSGRRFTIAHELCHLLGDRGRARRVTHSSTPWAPESIERRANAFAAMLLMPYGAVDAALADGGSVIDAESLKRVANRLRCGRTAVLEHFHNLDRIDPSAYFRIRSETASL